MNDETLDHIITRFNDGVAITPDRRGFGKQRGVPDSVFWLAPAWDPLPSQLLPILVELEGTFAGAADDFEKFAARAEDDEYQHHLEWPVFDVVDRDPITRYLEYNVVGIRAKQLTQEWSISEGKMHEAFHDWCKRFRSDFRTHTNMRTYGDTRVLDWQLEFTIFGHDVTSHTPFVVDPGSNLETVLNSRIDTPTIPCVVVVNDKYDNRDTTTFHYDTKIDFTTVSPARLQR